MIAFQVDLNACWSNFYLTNIATSQYGCTTPLWSLLYEPLAWFMVLFVFNVCMMSLCKEITFMHVLRFASLPYACARCICLLSLKMKVLSKKVCSDGNWSCACMRITDVLFIVYMFGRHTAKFIQTCIW